MIDVAGCVEVDLRGVGGGVVLGGGWARGEGEEKEENQQGGVKEHYRWTVICD